MLRIVQNTSASGSKTYFSRADYLSEGQELVGRWGGKGAELLGLKGEVDKKSFDRLCDNLHPETGRRLTARTKAERIVANDFTFSVPKGISIVALNGDERIIEAIRQSARETMGEIETALKTRVRKGGRNEERSAPTLVFAEFVHLCARPVDGVPDPDVHVHTFTFNCCFDDKEQIWKSGFFRDIRRDAPYYEAAFHARLGKRLEQLGYPIARSGKQWDLAEIPRSTAKKFSRRTEQIETLASKKGITDRDVKAGLGAKSREKKQKELSMPELRDVWRDRLTGDERKRLDELAKRKGMKPTRIADPHAEREAVDHAVLLCFERDSVIPEKELLAEALRYGLGKVDVDRVRSSLSAGGVIVRPLNGREMATHKEVLEEERSMIAYARDGRGVAEPLNPNWQIKREWLNAGQRAAVRHLVENRDAVASVVGDAGTGKTALARETVDGIRAGGHEVLMFAPSAQASRGVLRKEGFEDATTVAELLVNEKLQERARGQVIWIDEAGLIGSRTLKRVFDLAERISARVILSGDWKQHSSVERNAGGALRLLETEAGLRPAVVSEIERQKGDYRRAVGLVASGRVTEGFDEFVRLGWVQEIGSPVERNQQVARVYADSLQRGEEAIVICPTHSEGDRIQAAIRTELRARGLIGAEDHRVARLTSRNLTEAERGDAAMYNSGDTIVFTQNARGHKKGERIVVGESVSPELMKLAARFQVYRADEVPLAINDAVRISANGMSKDGRRLNNGAVYHVAGFTKEGDIRLDNGALLDRDGGFVTLAHVSTSHNSQGRSCEHHVLLAQSSQSLPATSREQFYVSTSRSRRRLSIFTDDSSALREAICNSDSRIAATELIGQKQRRVSLLRRVAEHARRIAEWRPNRGASKKGELSYGR